MPTAPTGPTGPDSPIGPTDQCRALRLLRGVRHGRLALTRQALPYVAVARHTVVDGQLLVRLHRGWDVHRACDGRVVAYQADNLDTGGRGRWALQFTGTARIVVPYDSQKTALPDTGDHDPVYLRIEPAVVTVQFAHGLPDWPGGGAVDLASGR